MMKIAEINERIAEVRVLGTDAQKDRLRLAVRTYKHFKSQRNREYLEKLLLTLENELLANII